MKLNEKQQEIINCFFENGMCFVNASAGTGKTSTITELYIKLLETKKEKVKNIAVITFTKAAANEMLLRIRLKVRNKIKESISSKNEEEIKYWHDIYKDILINAKISTINSFANSIAMDNAMKLSIPPNASILEDNSDFEAVLKEEILNTLKEADYSEKIRKIYRIYTEESKSQFADKVYNFLIKIKPRLESIEKFEEKALEVLDIEEKYNKVFNEVFEISNALIEDRGSENNTIKKFKIALKNTIEPIKKISKLENIKNISESEFEIIKYSINEVSSIPNRCGEKNIDFKECIEKLKKDLYKKIFHYLEIEINKENYIAVVNFIKDAYNKFEKVKKELGVYSYEDIMYKAIEALENKDIAKEIRDNITTLILDEAQDTSSLQFAFINLIVFGKREITDKDETDKKLLIVGDRKQSIYRFRNANLNVFMKTQNNFINYVRYLKDNYRSNSMLIKFFNDFFQNTVFSDDNIKYIDDDNLEYKKETDQKSAAILILNNNLENEDIKLNIEDRTELEAYSIAKYIKNNYYDYKGITILLQTFKRLNVYLRALSDLKIPYYIDGGNGFYEREEILLIKDFLEYLVLRDHSKLPALLRSDFFNIDISNLSDFLFTLFIEKLDIKDYFPVNILNKNNNNKILEIAKSKSYYNQLEKAKELLNEIERKSVMMNTFNIIETICIDTNYYNYLMTLEDAELSYANIEKLKDISIKFENQTGKNAYDFVLNLKNSNGNEPYSSIAKLSVEAVKIMTIHKSKGLEFDNVFLAGIGHSKTISSSDFDFIEGYPLIKLPVHNKDNDFSLELCSLDREYNKSSDESEKKRLLYVALTRASNNLVVSGEGSKSSYRNYFNNYIKKIEKYNFEVSSEDNNDLIEIDNIDHEFLKAYSYGISIKPDDNINNNILNLEDIKNKKLKDDNFIIKTIETISPSKINESKYSNKENNDSDIILSMLNKNISYDYEIESDKNKNDIYDENIKYISYKDMGIIIHKMLEHFNFELYKKEKDLYLEKVKNDILKSNKNYNESQMISNLNIVFEKLFENDHIKNIISGEEIIVSRESNFQDYNENKITNAVIDLITKNKNDEYFILDYKTTKPSTEKIEYYMPQLESYKNIFKKAYNIDESKIHTDLIFLK